MIFGLQVKILLQMKMERTILMKDFLQRTSKTSFWIVWSVNAPFQSHMFNMVAPQLLLVLPNLRDKMYISNSNNFRPFILLLKRKIWLKTCEGQWQTTLWKCQNKGYYVNINSRLTSKIRFTNKCRKIFQRSKTTSKSFSYYHVSRDTQYLR